MIELICLATEPLIPINNATFILQTQDPWMTLFIQISAVIAGGIIALIANYALQMHSFDVQGKTALINQRVAAYSELLLDIATFDSELTPISMAIPSHFYFHAAKAALYGSPIVEAKLQPWITNPNYDYRDHDFGVLIHESKSAMEAEIRAEKAKAKHWWQFWR